MFTSMNVALLVGFWRWLRGSQKGGLEADRPSDGRGGNGPMTPVMIVLTVVAALIASVGVGLAARLARRHGLSRWLIPYALQSQKRRGAAPWGRGARLTLHRRPLRAPQRRRLGRDGPRTGRAVGRGVPRLFGGFRDSDGRPPRHTFFFPIDEYESEHVDALAELCRAGFGEVEIHLHHDGDTAESAA